MLPDLRGRTVLDLGCGFGWFCRWARENGAARVLGIDVSEKMLARARDTTPDAAISYARADMERLELSPASFDLVYSSLALHYIANLDGLLSEVHRSLVEGGSLAFSSSIRSTRPRPTRTGSSMPRVARSGRSIAIWMKGPLD